MTEHSGNFFQKVNPGNHKINRVFIFFKILKVASPRIELSHRRPYFKRRHPINAYDVDDL